MSLTDQDLDAIRRDYTPAEPPPCRVCGAALAIQSMGGGQPTRWACSKARVGSANWLEHYNQSAWVEPHRSDNRVTALLEEVGRLRAGLAAIASHVAAMREHKPTTYLPPDSSSREQCRECGEWWPCGPWHAARAGIEAVERRTASGEVGDRG